MVEGAKEFSDAVPTGLLVPADIAVAQNMAAVYIAITAFERSARSFVRKVLMEEFDGDWWDKGVSEKIRRFAESRRADEMKTKWHGDRGEDLLDYTEMGHLPNIMLQNWSLFEAHISRIEWANSIFSTIERSRNVIMHSGVLSIEDAERVGMNIRDWTRQVGE